MTRNICIRLDDETVRRVDEEAKKQDRTRSMFLRRLVMSEMERLDAERKKGI